MDRARIITFKGKEIIIADYSGLSATHHYDELMQVINEAKALSAKDNTRKLFLTDVTGSSANKEIIAELKKFAKFTQENNLIEKECVVGVAGLKKFFLKAINRFSGSNIVSF